MAWFGHLKYKALQRRCKHEWGHTRTFVWKLATNWFLWSARYEIRGSSVLCPGRSSRRLFSLFVQLPGLRHSPCTKTPSGRWTGCFFQAIAGRDDNSLTPRPLWLVAPVPYPVSSYALSRRPYGLPYAKTETVDLDFATIPPSTRVLARIGYF